MSLQRYYSSPLFGYDSSLEHFMNDSLNHFFSDHGRRLNNFGPRIDVYETDKETVVHVELPGFKPEEVNLEINENVLQISGESKRDKQYEDNHVKVSERSFGKFSRSIQLRNGPDGDNIKAKFNNGILEIQVAKKPVAESRRIQIK
jgi:HSP20 family protein